MKPTDRTRQLLAVALSVAQATGWRTLTHAAVARAAGCSNGLVVARLGTADAMRRSVMRQAVAVRCPRVVAEGLAAQDKHAMRADAELRAAAAEWVRGAV